MVIYNESGKSDAARRGGPDSESRRAFLRDKRARSLAAMGLVTREGDRFQVLTAAMPDHQQKFEVWRDETGRVRCSCTEFEELSAMDSAFRCEHILAVKHSLTPDTTNQEAEVSISEEVVHSITTQVETVEAVNQGNAQHSESNNEVGRHEKSALPMFSELLRTLREPVNPRLIKTREGWTDRQGNVHMVEYVEWHTVADILDRRAPSWSHSVRNITQIGDLVAVVAAITIDNVTREGVGTGSAESETGIKKAEHDALKRAAIKFGIARDLYQRESEIIEGEESSRPSPNLPRDPLAKTLADLVTPRQIRMIRALGREIGCDVEQECQALLRCGTEDLSKRAASSFIETLQRRQKEMAKQAENEELLQAS